MTMIDEPDQPGREANEASECDERPSTWLRRHRSALLGGAMIFGGIVLISLDRWAAFSFLVVLLPCVICGMIVLHRWRT